MRTASVVGVVILGGLLAVAAARRRRAAPASPRPVWLPPEAAPAPPSPEPAAGFGPTLPATFVLAPEPSLPRPLTVVAGATALAPDPQPWPEPDERPALRLVDAPEPDPEELPEPLFEPERAPEFEPARWEICDISVWHGYTSWQLVATDPRTSNTIALSPAFRARRDKLAAEAKPAENETARRAVEALQDLLESYGWERVADGDAWYQGRFRRRS